jgi:hypothetical protein
MWKLIAFEAARFPAIAAVLGQFEQCGLVQLLVIIACLYPCLAFCNGC